MSELPKEWATCHLEECFSYVLGGDWGENPNQDRFGTALALCIRASEIRDWAKNKGRTAALRRLDVTSIAKRSLATGDILVEVSGGGPDQPVGRVVLIDDEVLSFQPEIPKVCTNFFRMARLQHHVYSKFLTNYLQHQHAIGKTREFQSGSNNLRNLRFQDFIAINVPIPPLAEQHRIVAKIEELFSELDAATENLTRARAQLKTYRQALLKAAFEGKLTADWRAANPDKIEPPKALLARIRAEREVRYVREIKEWEKALAEWRAGGEVGRKPAKPGRVTEIKVAHGPRALPQNWILVTTGSLGQIETGTTPPTKFARFFGGEVPFFKPTDLDTGYWVQRSREHLTEDGLEASRGFPPDTVLVTCIGATIGKTGLTRVAGACNQQINFIVPDTLSSPRFTFFQITSPAYQEQIKNNASSTTLPIINKTKFSEIPFAVCGPDEQAMLVALLEEKLSEVESSQAEIDAALTKIDALRQSILKKAFSGQLVPQDPTDEPASVLLARLRDEDAPAPKTRRKKRA